MATAELVAPIPPQPAMEELPMDLASHLPFRLTPDLQVVLQLLLQAKEVVEFRYPDPELDLLVQARLTRTTAQEAGPMPQILPGPLQAKRLALTPAHMAPTVPLSLVE
jgi:hypothetical protein